MFRRMASLAFMAPFRSERSFSFKLIGLFQNKGWNIGTGAGFVNTLGNIY
jgi:hypothetical protein